MTRQYMEQKQRLETHILLPSLQDAKRRGFPRDAQRQNHSLVLIPACIPMSVPARNQMVEMFGVEQKEERGLIFFFLA